MSRSEPGAVIAHDFASRLAALRAAPELAGADAVLLSSAVSLRYFFGFTGSALAIVGPVDIAFFTDSRYAETAEETLAVAGVDATVEYSGGTAANRAVQDCLRVYHQVGFESRHVTVDEFAVLDRIPAVEFIPLGERVNALRLVKQPSEISRMKLAADIASTALESLMETLSPDDSELEVARRLERLSLDLGADEMAFSTIVGAGTNSARPHAHPSHARIGSGSPVVIDFGVAVDGYRSDMTRTVWSGSLPSRSREIYAAALAANHAGRAVVAAGRTYADVDRACRAELADRGLEEHFTHPSGHNIGLAVHELPYLTSENQTPLRAGQVITVEPGVYVAGVAGARVEDMLVVGASGSIRLTESGYLGPDDHV